MLGVAGPKPPGPKYGQPVAPNLNVRQICPNCRIDPPNIIEEYSKGDLVCADCGVILGDRIVDTRSEWRTFAGDEGGDDPSRVGDAGNPLLGSNHLDTMISGRDGMTGMSRDLQRAQNRANAHNHNGRTSTANLQAAFARISEKCDIMQLGSGITTRAQHVFKIADEKKVNKGKNEDTVIAACMIFACRDAGANRSFTEVCKALRVNKKDLGQVFQLIKIAVQEERSRTGAAPSTSGIASLSDTVEGLMGRYCNFLNINMSTFNAAKYISNKAASKADIDGRTYPSIAGGVLYLSCVLFGVNTSAKDLAGVAGITDSTIKLICKKVAAKLDLVIKPEWKDRNPKGYESLLAMGRVNDAGPPSRQRSGTPKDNGNGETKDVKSRNSPPVRTESPVPVLKGVIA